MTINKKSLFVGLHSSTCEEDSRSGSLMSLQEHTGTHRQSNGSSSDRTFPPNHPFLGQTCRHTLTLTLLPCASLLQRSIATLSSLSEPCTSRICQRRWSTSSCYGIITARIGNLLWLFLRSAIITAFTGKAGNHTLRL
jgi:hypothetical protein